MTSDSEEDEDEHSEEEDDSDEHSEEDEDSGDNEEDEDSDEDPTEDAMGVKLSDSVWTVEGEKNLCLILLTYSHSYIVISD